MTISEPKVGILWLFNHEIIFSHSVPLSEGFLYGEAITGIKDHAAYWEELRKKKELFQLPVRL